MVGMTAHNARLVEKAALFCALSAWRPAFWDLFADVIFAKIDSKIQQQAAQLTPEASKRKESDNRFPSFA